MATRTVNRLIPLFGSLRSMGSVGIARPTGKVTVARPNFFSNGSFVAKFNTCTRNKVAKYSLMLCKDTKKDLSFVARTKKDFSFLARTLMSSKLSSSSSSDELRLGPSSGLFYFDTHLLVSSLQTKGFTLEQAEAITNSLTQIISSGTTALSKYMVTRSELAQLEIRMNASIEALRKDMVILEKSESMVLKQENENVKSEVTNLSRYLRDELLKLKSGLALDLSLEKSRIREESSVHEQKIKDANNRIDTEVARVRMEMEAQKLDLIKYLVGSFFSILTVLIGWWRFVKS